MMGAASGASAQDAGVLQCRPSCRTGYVCVDGECVSACNPPCAAEETCTAEGECVVEERPPAAPAPAAAAEGTWGGEAPASEWNAPRVEPERPFEGTQGYVGTSFGGTLTWLDIGGNISTFGGIVWALRGGVLIGRGELGIEVAPFTHIHDFDDDPSFSAVFHGGAHIRITDTISWPMRAGVGVLAGNTPGVGDDPWFVLRADLIGLSFLLGDFLVEVDVPSFRFHSDGESQLTTLWFGLSGTYVF